MAQQAQVSKHVLDRKRANRRQIIWTVSLAVITVLAMTLYDLKYRTYKTYHAPAISTHYITSADQLGNLPDDYSSVTIYQGSVGDTPATPADIAPVNLPQRQVDLVFDIGTLGVDQQAAAIDEINAELNAWERQSNIVSDAILDTRTPPAMSPQELLGFITALRDSHKLEYRASVIVNPNDPANPVVAADAPTREALKKQVTALVLFATDDNIASDIAAMDALGFPYSIITPAGTNPDSYQSETLGKSKFYRGMMVSAGPAEPKDAPDAP